MAEPLGERLPAQVLRMFDGNDLEAKIGPAHLLVTVDADGTPRPCMLSAGEVLAPAGDRLRVILWAGSQTSRNLARGGRALLCYVDGGDVFYVKGRAHRLPAAAGPGRGLEPFEIRVDEVETDRHQGMPLVSGLRFTVADAERAAVAGAWERQLAALRE
jgi:hypothetical protein